MSTPLVHDMILSISYKLSFTETYARAKSETRAQGIDWLATKASIQELPKNSIYQESVAFPSTGVAGGNDLVKKCAN